MFSVVKNNKRAGDRAGDRVRGGSASSNTKPYCRACHNAGKTIEDYTSHWTRSSPGSDGVIICPLILSSECGYCHAVGHWTKFCPVIETGGGCERRNSKSKNSAAEGPVVGDVGGNYFDALGDMDSEDENASVSSMVSNGSVKKVDGWKKALGVEIVDLETKKVDVLKKALGMGMDNLTTSSTASTAAVSWASIVSSKPLPPKAAVEGGVKVVGELSKVSLSEMKRVFGSYKRTLNWADVDSDDEDEDEDIILPVGALA